MAFFFLLSLYFPVHFCDLFAILLVYDFLYFTQQVAQCFSFL